LPPLGYHRAGFDVVGVDVVAQPNYPFHFHRGDALDALRVYLTRDAGIDGSRAWQPFDAIHASPPCKRFTAARGDRHANRLFEPHTDYLRPTLAALSAVALPWIVENVPNAPMPPGAVTLCGSSFDLDVRRHRLFASNVPIRGLACRHADQERGRYPSLDWERRSSGRRAAVVGVHPTLHYVNETWDEKMHRLAVELAELRAETEYAPPYDKRWRQWSPRYRDLRYAIDQHVRRVPLPA
jgi:hypothetical protein